LWIQDFGESVLPVAEHFDQQTLCHPHFGAHALRNVVPAGRIGSRADDKCMNQAVRRDEPGGSRKCCERGVTERASRWFQRHPSAPSQTAQWPTGCILILRKPGTQRRPEGGNDETLNEFHGDRCGRAILVNNYAARRSYIVLPKLVGDAPRSWVASGDPKLGFAESAQRGTSYTLSEIIR
jgi:hypothetical protein